MPEFPPLFFENPRWLGELPDPEEELTEDQQVELEAKIKELDSIIDLFDSRGWQILQATLEDKSVDASDKVLRYTTTQDETNHLRGIVTALGEVLALPEQLRADREALRDQLKGENG